MKTGFTIILALIAFWCSSGLAQAEKMVYINNSDGWRAYIREVWWTGNGTAITSEWGILFVSISPDETKIVYTNSDGYLKMKNVSDSGNWSNILSSGFGYWASFSPDWNKIYYSKWEVAWTKCGTVYFRWTDFALDDWQVFLYANVNWWGCNFRFSPDWSKVYYTRYLWSAIWNIYVKDENSSNPYDWGILNSTRSVFSFDLSKDGTKIAYTNNGTYPTRIFIRNVNEDVDGIDLTPGHFSYNPAFDRSGTRLYFIQEYFSIWSALVDWTDQKAETTSDNYGSLYVSNTPYVPTQETISWAICTEKKYFDSYAEIPGWGTLSPDSSTSSGTESVGIWDGFLNLFRDNKTKANTYYRGFYWTWSRVDTLVFQYLDAWSKIENPYAWEWISTIEWSDVFFTVRSKSWTISRIDGITVETVWIYATWSYWIAHFYDTSDKEIFRSKMLPYSSGSSNYVGSFVPGTLANFPVKVIVTGANWMVFKKIIPVYWIGWSYYKSCKNSNTFCGWRRSWWIPTNPLACVDESEYFTDPYSEVVSYLCETSWNACKPKALTWTYLWTEWVLTSLIIGGKGAYYVDASGSLRYDPEKRNISWYDKNSAFFKCDLEGLAWYEKVLWYFDCTWNKLLTPASDAINTPTKITNETLNTVGKAGSGSNSIRSFFRTSPGSGEWEKSAPIVSIVEGKSFYDMPSGLGRFFLTAFIVVIGMIVLWIVAMLIFNRWK